MSHSDHSQEEGGVDFEASGELQEMLKTAPFALPLPVELLKQHGVGVKDIPKGHLLNDHEGDLEMRVTNHAPLPEAKGLESFRMAPGGEAASSEWLAKRDEPSLVNTPLPATNKGRHPGSRWFIRGLLHEHPLRFYLGALSTVLIVWLIPASLVAAGLLILSSEMPDRFDWVSSQLLWIPVAFFLVGLMYLTLGLSSSCRVCRQKLFIYRSSAKNDQAHHFPGLGYVLPLCLHLMVFRWFRCSHCGTPIRLKK